MKTDQVAGKGNAPYGIVDRQRSEMKIQEMEQAKKEASKAVEKEVEKAAETKDLPKNHLDAVKKLIGENVQWREMRFYRHEYDGKVYVDVVDKKTGQVVRTVPEPDFVEIATKFKHLSGLTLNING
ncbi:MAG: flagellar protein FlaG [Proteobacteria bacterium]|nr:flagellar protein FlaG [Pseudomonadota bacterium]